MAKKKLDFAQKALLAVEKAIGGYLSTAKRAKKKPYKKKISKKSS